MPCLLFGWREQDIVGGYNIAYALLSAAKVDAEECPNPNRDDDDAKLLEIEFVVCGEERANATSTAAAAENNIYIMSANEDGISGILRRVIVYIPVAVVL